MINTASATFTRPANTTAYAAGDEISNSVTAGSALPMVFSNLTDSMFGTGKILKAKLSVSQQGFTGKVSILLFDEAPTMSGDNSQHVLFLAQAPSYLGVIDFSAGVISPTGSEVSLIVNSTAQQVIVSKNKNGGNPIYGVLIATAAITPTSGQQFSVELFCEPRTTVN